MVKQFPALPAFAAIFALPLLVSAAPVPKQTPPVAWVFQMHRDAQTNPHTDVFLRVGSKQTLVMHSAPDEFHAVAKADYKDSGIPATALTACLGWWAGAGDQLYVVRRGRALVVYRREEDEQAPDFPWKRFQVIPLP